MDDRPEGHEYEDFELSLEEKLNLKEIERCLRNGLYKEETMVRDHLDLLENLDTEVANALAVENRIGRYNATAKHDQDKVRGLMKQLEAKLNDFDSEGKA